ncbi:unnamed protein product [Acanthoscelides obtectus]|uniref:Uncharacterized protein n=1 Tax=Acanthoscelides obtectus TaxID=200917 RepID=A0A9P0JXZ1_ACAOB|nr:unnamed protein product [Acanthoscelides obtectus]CAK1642224.1 hypothetical protein AOBTE_LOCUS12900 [Acanthoscelides obtectus]
MFPCNSEEHKCLHEEIEERQCLLENRTVSMNCKRGEYNKFQIDRQEMELVARRVPVTSEEKLPTEVRGCYVQFCEITCRMCFVPTRPHLEVKLDL